jgi:hypothetical protein
MKKEIEGGKISDSMLEIVRVNQETLECSGSKAAIRQTRGSFTRLAVTVISLGLPSLCLGNMPSKFS